MYVLLLIHISLRNITRSYRNILITNLTGSNVLMRTFSNSRSNVETNRILSINWFQSLNHRIRFIHTFFNDVVFLNTGVSQCK